MSTADPCSLKIQTLQIHPPSPLRDTEQNIKEIRPPQQ